MDFSQKRSQRKAKLLQGLERRYQNLNLCWQKKCQLQLFWVKKLQKLLGKWCDFYWRFHILTPPKSYFLKFSGQKKKSKSWKKKNNFILLVEFLMTPPVGALAVSFCFGLQSSYCMPHWSCSVCRLKLK